MEHIKGSLEDILDGCHHDTKAIDNYDAFVAFHPGAGTNFDYSWSDGFDLIRESGKPLLLTAYDERDALKDDYWWEYTYSKALTYERNPWASVALTSTNEVIGDAVESTCTLNGFATVVRST